MGEFIIKKDKYSQNRGGNSKILKIFCKKCDEFLLIYQKDGPGILKRLYLDRIVIPMNLVELEKLDIEKIPYLTCSKCNNIIGVAYLHDREGRKAYMLEIGSFIKKILNKAEITKI